MSQDTVVELPLATPPVTAGRGRISLRRLVSGSLNYAPLLKSQYGVRPLFALFLLGFFSNLATVGNPYLFLMVKHDLGLNFTKFQAIGSAITAAGLLLAAPIGYLADRTKRTVMLGIGGIFHALALLLQGFGYNAIVYSAGQGMDQVSTDLKLVPQGSLVADYYPVEHRARAITFFATATQLVGLLLPLPMAFVVENYGWRVMFWFAWIPVLLVSLYIIFRLPEPQRGYQERKAMGASEEVARHEQPKPSWAESWRSVWSVKTVRYGFYAQALTTAGGIFSIYQVAYFVEKWHQTPTQVAAIGTMIQLASVVSLLVLGGMFGFIAVARPQRVLQGLSLLHLASALSSALVVLVPILWLSIAFRIVFAAIGISAAVSAGAVLFNVMPPRARGIAMSIPAYLTIPTLILRPLTGSIVDTVGLQTAVLIGALLPVAASVVSLIAARYYEYDFRNAQLSAMATEEHATSKREGRVKQLVCRQVDVHYGSVQVLFGVDFDVDEGEMIALLGTNGAGKSTLLRAICGLSEASAGAVVFDGDDVTHIPPNEIAAKGIVYMQGGKSGFPSLTVRENLALGSWLQRKNREFGADLGHVFAYFPVLRDRLDQVAGTLSGGEQQMLALSQAFLTRPRMLLIDELSLGLAPAVVDQLLAIVRAIHENGTTVVIVEQSVNIALKVAERAIFMEKGEVRFSGPTADLLNRPDILRSVFLKGASGAGSDRELAAVSGFATSGLTEGSKRLAQLSENTSVLEVWNLVKSFGGRPVLRDVHFDLREGEILGIIGANGAGKTTLFDVLSGFSPQDSGQIFYNGEDISLWTPDARARAGLIRRFQDARLFPTLTVAEAIAISFERQLEVRSMVMHGLALPAARRAEKRLRAKVDNLVDLMQLGAFRDKFVSDLSTGSRRIVDLACVIATSPRVLLLDEPSAGIAQKESEEMGPLLQRVRYQTGCSMLVIEHDMGLISRLADELLVLHLGEVMMRGEPRMVLDDERVVNAYLGRGQAEPELVGAGQRE